MGSRFAAHIFFAYDNTAIINKFFIKLLFIFKLIYD